MALAGLNNADLKLILFGGKGGVGKTSCAAATATALARHSKTLLISTDPAHSVSDSLGMQSGHNVAPVEGIENLWSTEIAADEAFQSFKNNNQAELQKLLETSTNLDDEDIGDLLKLTIPGIDEIMSFKSIIDFIDDGHFDKYVVDMAPSGHALRLIASPQLLDQWIKMAAKMRWKYRYMVTSFAGKYQPDPTDAMLVNLKKTVKKIELLFSDNSKCEFIPVSIPEAMAVAETERLINNLKRFKIEVKQLIVNNVMTSEGCDFCKERKQGQQKHLDSLKNSYPNFNLVFVPLFSKEISGIKNLEKLRKHLINGEQKK
jgi:arsenite/tail-anchored protein-transporting ATPase